MESREVDFSLALGRLVLGDDSLGRALIELGEICQGGGRKIIDNSPLYWALRNSLEWIRVNSLLTSSELEEAEDTLNGILQRLSPARSRRADGDSIVRELKLSARMLLHGVRRTRLALSQDEQEIERLRYELHAELPSLVGDFNENWLRRYRVGGLVGTSARLAALDSDYRVG